MMHKKFKLYIEIFLKIRWYSKITKLFYKFNLIRLIKYILLSLSTKIIEDN